MRKYLFFILLCTFFSLTSLGQTPEQDFNREVLVQDWTVPDGLHEKIAGAPSFYYAVTRMPNYYNNGYYYYKVYFFSGSYYTNGQWAGTYLENLTVYADGVAVSSVQWLLFNRTYSARPFHFYSTNTQPRIGFYWTLMRVN